LIVVDTNVLVYAVLPGEGTADVNRAAARDAAWVAPALWRREFRNVLATAMRVRGLPLDRALEAFAAAEGLVADAQIEPTTEECLEIAARGGVSAWDAEFVFVAERLGARLVTGDRRLASAFPETAKLLADFVAEP
jgi:predicted nucleic acid-binding protein